MAPGADFVDGEGLQPEVGHELAGGILCDDTEVGTSADVNALVYLAGSFDPDRLIVKENYTMTAGDIAALRDGGIYLKAQIDADYVQSN